MTSPAPPAPTLENLSRRAFLRAFSALSVYGPLAMALAGCSSMERLKQSFVETGNNLNIGGSGLGTLAQRHGYVYGAAVQSRQLENEIFAAALRREAAMLVPEQELKWNILRPSERSFDFSGYRKIAEFAQANDMTMRGHALLWHRANPRWLAPALKNRKAAEKILEAHIGRVVRETAPMIRSWDVVNEAVYPKSGRDDGLRDTVWLKALGPEYVSLAFHMAHKADPELTLVYNDYGTERAGSDWRAKRQYILRLLDQMVRKNVPVHGFGLQSHLRAHQPLAAGEFAAFVKEVRARGLKILVTELDLDASRLYGSVDDRIALAQNYLATYLEMIEESGPVDTLLTWGLSDKYSWLHESQSDVAGALPLDAGMHRGPMWETLRKVWLGNQ